MTLSPVISSQLGNEALKRIERTGERCKTKPRISYLRYYPVLCTGAGSCGRWWCLFPPTGQSCCVLSFFLFSPGNSSRGLNPWRRAHMIVTRPSATIPSAKVDISLLLKPDDEEETTRRKTEYQPPSTSRSSGTMPTATRITPPMLTSPESLVGTPQGITPLQPSSRKRSQPSHAAEPPAKKQSKWSVDEDALIIELRGRGMKWEDISKRLPGRSAISCRLHYQNYLERRSEWDEDRKNKLARLYER